MNSAHPARSIFGVFASMLFCLAALPTLRAGQQVQLDSGVQVDLTFSEKYPEAPGLLKKACGQNAGDVIDKAELLQVFDASKAPMKTSRSQTVETTSAHSGAVLLGTSQSILLWGPYAEFDSGDYFIVYRFRVEAAPPVGSRIFLDVSHNACTTAGEKIDASTLAQEKWQEIAIPVHLPVGKALEFRFWPEGNTVSIDRIYVFKTNQVKPTGAAPAGALPQGIAVPGQPNVIMSPYNEEKGHIDIKGLPAGATLRCPYTKKKFTLPDS